MHLDANVRGGTDQAYYVQFRIRVRNPLPKPIALRSASTPLFLTIVEDEDGNEITRFGFPDDVRSTTLSPNGDITHTHSLNELGGGNTYTVSVHFIGFAQPMGSEQRELVSTTVTV